MYKILLQKSRSYGGREAKTDHKLVKANSKLNWLRMKQKHKPSERLNIKKLKNQQSDSFMHQNSMAN